MAKKKTKQGRIFVHTSKGVFPYEVLKKAEVRTSSKQLESISTWVIQNNLVPPPFPPKSFLSLYEANPIFWRCVNQLAIDVAGLGWSLRVREGLKDSQKELNRINELLLKPNPDDSFRFILKQLLIDWGTIGWFGLEVIRNRLGDVAEIFYVPAHTLKVHKSKKKYAQVRNNKKVWFKRFGEPKDISAKDGTPHTGNRRTVANELIFYKNHYPMSDYYGVPNIISAIGDVVGMIGLRDYNLAFFENYGIPAALIVLEGDWAEGSDKKVSDFLNKEIKGTDNAHRTLVVMQGGGEGGGDDCKFHYEKLGIEVKEASFKLYEQARRDNILIAYSMPPERIGVRVVGKLGGNVAEEATKIYVQSVVEPLQLDMEDIINQKLLQSEVYEFKFADIDIRNLDLLIKQLGYQIERGMKTPNEARNILGDKPYPDGDKLYMMSSLVVVGEPNPEDKFTKAERELLNDFESSNTQV